MITDFCDGKGGQCRHKIVHQNRIPPANGFDCGDSLVGMALFAALVIFKLERP